jgi:hypothetical protein
MRESNENRNILEGVLLVLFLVSVSLLGTIIHWPGYPAHERHPDYQRLTPRAGGESWNLPPRRACPRPCPWYWRWSCP